LSDDATPRAHPVVAVDRRGAAVIVQLAGELDLYNADAIRAALGQAIDDGVDRVVIEMSQVEFIDSTALGVLIETHSKLGRGRLLLATPQLETRRALEVSGLDRHLPVHESVDEALAAPN
jgi:anti-anti-sigma factor